MDLSFVVTSSLAVQPFTASKLGFKPGRLFMTVEDNDIRIWYGGTTPTNTSGHKIFVGNFYTSDQGPNIENLKIISTSGNAKVFATVSGA